MKKLNGQIEDLKKVAFSAELRTGMQEHMQDMQVAHAAMEQWMQSERTNEEKKDYMKQLEEELKPALSAMKEAARRIKGAGLGKGNGDSEAESIMSGRWDLAKS